MLAASEGGALSPPAFVRVCLEQAIRSGRPPFMAVWTHALHSLPRGTTPEVVRERKHWVAILKWSRPAWQAYYEQRPLTEVLGQAEEELTLAA